MYFKDDVIAFIGPACAFALEPVARLAAYWNLPIITGMGDQVSSRNNYNEMLNMCYPSLSWQLRKVEISAPVLWPRYSFWGIHLSNSPHNFQNFILLLLSTFFVRIFATRNAICVQLFRREYTKYYRRPVKTFPRLSSCL